MHKNKLFDILTLSDCVGCDDSYQNNKLFPFTRPRLGDPVTIITGGIGILSQLFPGLFGVARRRLNPSDWIKLFPGDGEWTVKLRTYLASRIHYDVDLKNIQPFTDIEFITEYRNQIPGCGGKADQNCIQSLYSILQQEQRAQTPGGAYYTEPTSNLSLLLLGVGALFLITQANKKKGRR